MDEKPKSIWKKAFTGRTAMVIWLAVAVFTVMLGGFIVTLNNYNRPMSDGLMAVEILAGVFLAACLLLIYVVWPLLRWLFGKHWRQTLFALACFITLIALFYAEEDWRGWHAWNKFKHEWEAKGEKFDFASVVPPPVPDDQNFAMSPIVFTSYGSMLTRSGKVIPYKDRDTNFVNRLALNVLRDNNTYWENGVYPAMGHWAEGIITDLKPWQAYYRAPAQTNSRNLTITTNEFPIAPQPQTPAEDVLLAMSRFDSTIEELRQASKLPYSRFPLEYDKDDPGAIMLPHLASLKGCSQVLQLRAIAELQNGQSDEALDDIKLMLRLTDSMHTEPFLISHLVRIAIVNLTLQPVWEGLAEHKWSDAQLAELDSELAKLDFLPDYGAAMRGEMVLCQEGIIEYLRHHSEQLPNMSGEGDFNTGLPARICWLIPSGWFYQNQLRCSRFMVQQYLPLADLEHRIIPPASLRHAEAALDLEFRHASPYNRLEVMFLPSLGGAVKKFASGQAAVDLARTAIALEHYRLAHGEFPESFDVLAPQFIAKLPHDVINGQPLRYRRDPPSPGSGAASGQFVLYSVGWNETDDGGEVAFKKEGAVDVNNGDWVWRYPSK
jgi:hypothetical protein